ncbi:MAG: 3-deoxy-D-manno-octulosonic acid transferase [Hyphomicrobiaceae bacterium]|nr:3-deoxy-D-manno-octulosonic acid transferase [Hyphomicrobiaceae bacterium]
MAGDGLLSVYRASGRALAPLFSGLLHLRALRGKEDPHRRGERYGKPSLPRPAGRLVWIHAASVGETNSVLPLIARLIGAGAKVLLTTGTVTSARLAAQRLPAGALHQFVPLDIAPYVTRFLDHWRPDLVLFVESELWPTTLSLLAARGLAPVLVNGRMSVRSHRRWRQLGGLRSAIFGRLGEVLAQTDDDAARFADLGVGRVTATGNLKFDAPALVLHDRDLATLRAAIDRRPVWLAASTHPGEEDIAADVHHRLADRLPRLLTVIVPRHPERGGDIATELARQGHRVARRSLGEVPGDETDIYLADTLGELGLFYRLVPVAFLGGSLVERGGQNPIEAARLDCVILHGPKVENFKQVYAAFDATGAGIAIADAGALAAEVAGILTDPQAHQPRIEAGRRVIDQHSGALERTVAALADRMRDDHGSDR